MRNTRVKSLFMDLKQVIHAMTDFGLNVECIMSLALRVQYMLFGNLIHMRKLIVSVKNNLIIN